MVSLADEMVLLAYDDERGTLGVSGAHLDLGLGGALLLELVLADRIEVVGKRVRVRDAAPTGDPLVDEALRRIAAETRHRKPGHWVPKLAKGTRAQVLAGLTRAGLLRELRAKVLWIFPVTRYPAPGGRPPAPEAEARHRLRAAITGPGAVDRRTAALCALVAAVGLGGKVFARVPKGQVKQRLKEIDADAWPAQAVKQAIDEVQAAITSAIVATTVVTTASS